MVFWSNSALQPINRCDTSVARPLPGVYTYPRDGYRSLTPLLLMSGSTGLNVQLVLHTKICTLTAGSRVHFHFYRIAHAQVLCQLLDKPWSQVDRSFSLPVLASNFYRT